MYSPRAKESPFTGRSDRNVTEISSQHLQVLLQSPSWQKYLHDASYDKVSSRSASSVAASFVRNLLVLRGCRIFYWHAESAAVITCDVRDGELEKIAILSCDIPPLFEVTSVHLSSAGSCLALVGSKGLSVLDVGPDESIPESGRKTARCIAISERFFLNNPRVAILQCAWFPSRETHVVLLTSDNNLKLYRISSPSQPEVVVPLQGSSTKRSFHNFCAFTLVQFASGKQTLITAFKSPDRNSATASVFALRSDGNVYTCDLTAGCERSAASSLRGPLTSNISLGADASQVASSIAVFEAAVPVVVIATNTEKIFHGILLEKDDIEIDAQESSGSHPATQELLVIEKLELVRLQEVSKGTIPKSVNNARLVTDAAFPDCYVYASAQRLYGITLPWLDDLTLLDSMGTDSLRRSSVRTVLSLDPFDVADDLSISGAQLVRTGKGECSLLSTASNGQVSVQPLSSSKSRSSDRADSSRTEPPADRSSRRKQANETPFFDVVQALLRRERSLPAFSFAKPELISAEDLQNIVDQGLAVYDKEYVNRQLQVMTEIQNRQERLKRRRKELAELVRNMESKIIQLTEQYHEFTNQCDYVETDVLHTHDRISSLQTELAAFNPTLTDAELRLRDDLRGMETRLATVEELLETVEQNIMYKERQMSAMKNSPRSQRSPGTPETFSLHSAATNTLSRIEILKRRMKDVKARLDVE